MLANFQLRKTILPPGSPDARDFLDSARIGFDSKFFNSIDVAMTADYSRSNTTNCEFISCRDPHRLLCAQVNAALPSRASFNPLLDPAMTFIRSNPVSPKFAKHAIYIAISSALSGVRYAVFPAVAVALIHVPLKYRANVSAHHQQPIVGDSSYRQVS